MVAYRIPNCLRNLYFKHGLQPEWKESRKSLLIRNISTSDSKLQGVPLWRCLKFCTERDRNRVTRHLVVYGFSFFIVVCIWVVLLKTQGDVGDKNRRNLREGTEVWVSIQNWRLSNIYTHLFDTYEVSRSPRSLKDTDDYISEYRKP